MKTIKVNNVLDVPKNYTGIVEYPNGLKGWWLNGEHHRTDGPAVEYPSGTKEYCLNNKFLNENKIDQLVEKFGYPIETAIKIAYLLEINNS